MREPVYLSFDNCKVPCENVLGEEGKAFHLGKKWLPARRIMRGARCVGAAQRILEESTTQAQTWTSFGQTISGRPSIQAALGDMATNIHASRLMVYEAAWRADEGKPVQREAAMVKLFATQMIHFVADNAAHIFNAPPYVAGVPMERFCRNALAISSTNLALQLQRNIIARDILKGLKI
jgi:alkylation response protein AidB-like acyl-CoA dehydrogenase